MQGYSLVIIESVLSWHSPVNEIILPSLEWLLEVINLFCIRLFTILVTQHFCKHLGLFMHGTGNWQNITA